MASPDPARVKPGPRASGVHPRGMSRGAAAVPVAALFLAACATTGPSPREMNAYLLRGEFAPAAARVEQAKAGYGEKNALLFFLDRGMLLHLAGEYAPSNQAFEEAKRVARDLFTKSVTAHAATFLVNDTVTPYYGEDFERALIHVFSAVNYALLGDGEGALVECRQADLFLRTLRIDQGHKSRYTEDALARYLAGMLYEDRGEVNDAHISYVKALEAYDAYGKHYKTPRPEGLLEDALRTARALGFRDRVSEIQRRWGDAKTAPAAAGTGEVVLLHYAGLGPEKVDSFFEVSVVNGWAYVEAQPASDQAAADVQRAQAVLRSVAADKMIRVAVPKYRRNPARIRSAEVAAGERRSAPASLVEDVGAIAERNLEDRWARTQARAIARAVTKYLIAQEVGQAVEKNRGENTGFVVKALLQAAGALTEVADKRHWRTLPDRILMARLALPAGEHALTLRFTDEAGAVVETRERAGVSVQAGRKTFLVARTAQ